MATAFSSPITTGTDELVRALEVPLGLRPPPQLAQRIPKDQERKLADLVKRLCADADGRMWPWRRKWRMNEEYWNGNFNFTWDYTANQTTRRPGEPYQGFGVHLNVMRPTVNIWVARLLSTKPQPQILPGSTDTDVIDAAETAQRIASDWQWHVQQMDKQRDKFLRLLELKGTAIWKLVWNPKAGRYLGKSPRLLRDEKGNPIQRLMVGPMGQPEPMIGEDGAPVFEFEYGPDGQPILDDAWSGGNELKTVDPEDFLVDPVATDFDDAMWCAHVSEQHVAWVFNQYQVRVEPDGDLNNRDSFGVATFFDPTNRSRWKDRKASCIVRELWIRKGQYPYGDKPGDVMNFERDYMIVEAGGKILDHGPNVYEHGRFPFIFATLPGPTKQLWGETRASDVRGLQATILDTGNQIARSNKMMGSPRITFGAGAKILEAHRTNKEGAWIEVASGTMQHEFPRVMEGATVSPGVFRWFDSIFQNWLPFISGNHLGGLAGGAPPNVEAAAAFVELAERDTTQLTPDSLAYGLALQLWLEMTMLNCKQFMSVPEMVQVTGRNKEPEVVAFSGTDIRDSFKYSIVPSSVIPQSSAAKFQKTVTLFNLHDETGRPLLSRRDVLRRLGEEPNEARTTEEFQADAAKRDVFDARMRGEFSLPEQVLPLVGNPEIFMEEYGRFLLEYRPSDNPVAYGLILNRAMALMMQTQQQAMAQQGVAPGGEGPQSAPGGAPEQPRPDQPIPGGGAPEGV